MPLNPFSVLKLMNRQSSFFSESKESESAKTDTELESNAKVTEYEPVESETPKQTEPVLQEENNVSETKPAVTESSSAPVEKPEKTEPPAEIPPQTVPEDTKPKTAYDYEFDIETVKVFGSQQIDALISQAKEQEQQRKHTKQPSNQRTKRIRNNDFER